MATAGMVLSQDVVKRAERTGVLDLSKRGLTSLPEEIVQLTGLRSLRLDGNGLTRLPAKSSSSLDE
jgi:hypothetical protein